MHASAVSGVYTLKHGSFHSSRANAALLGRPVSITWLLMWHACAGVRKTGMHGDKLPDGRLLIWLLHCRCLTSPKVCLSCKVGSCVEVFSGVGRFIVTETVCKRLHT